MLPPFLLLVLIFTCEAFIDPNVNRIRQFVLKPVSARVTSEEPQSPLTSVLSSATDFSKIIGVGAIVMNFAIPAFAKDKEGSKGEKRFENCMSKVRSQNIQYINCIIFCFILYYATF
jgi:hypothetical protein